MSRTMGRRLDLAHDEIREVWHNIDKQRWETLMQALWVRNIPYRDDSMLTRNFVLQECDPTYQCAEDVANTMFVMDIIHNQTLYPEMVEGTLRMLADSLHAQYPHVSWSSLWTTTRFHGTIALKLQCLAMAGFSL